MSLIVLQVSSSAGISFFLNRVRLNQLPGSAVRALISELAQSQNPSSALKRLLPKKTQCTAKTFIIIIIIYHHKHIAR